MKILLQAMSLVGVIVLGGANAMAWECSYDSDCTKRNPNADLKCCDTDTEKCVKCASYTEDQPIASDDASSQSEDDQICRLETEPTQNG